MAPVLRVAGRAREVRAPPRGAGKSTGCRDRDSRPERPGSVRFFGRQTVPLESAVELRSRQSEQPRRLGFVPARTLERLAHERLLELVQTYPVGGQDRKLAGGAPGRFGVEVAG